jgi:hypothetical protein
MNTSRAAQQGVLDVVAWHGAQSQRTLPRVPSWRLEALSRDYNPSRPVSTGHCFATTDFADNQDSMHVLGLREPYRFIHRIVNPMTRIKLQKTKLFDPSFPSNVKVFIGLKQFPFANKC